MVEIQEEGCDLTANSLHPGIIGTNIVRYITINSNIIENIFPNTLKQYPKP